MKDKDKENKNGQIKGKGEVKCSPEELKVKELEEFAQWSPNHLKNGHLPILKDH